MTDIRKLLDAATPGPLVDEDAANVRMIALAPKLAEALLVAMEALGRTAENRVVCGDCKLSLAEIQHDARSALAAVNKTMGE